MGDSNATNDQVESPATSTDAGTKPKRVRRPNHRRPKMMPAATRQRLSNLGFQPTSYDTTDTNLTELMEKMTSDLQRYTISAEHWQNRLLALRANSSEGKEGENRNGSSQQGSNSFGVGTGAESSSLGPLTAFERDMLQRLKRASEPSLEVVKMPEPRVRSAVTNFLSESLQEEYFNRVLTNVSQLAGVFGMFPGKGGRLDAISRLKPNFSSKRARRVWRDVFAPIDTETASFKWESASGSRRSQSHTHRFISQSSGSSVSSPANSTLPTYHVSSYETTTLGTAGPRYIDPADPDFDHMDRRLAEMSDEDVVDMLHYCSLMIIGFSDISTEDPTFEAARDHMGKNCERLLRELIFSRNATTSPFTAQGLLAGMMGVLRFFSLQQRTGAVLSMMEMAWQMAMNHVTDVHPIMKGLISFISTVLAPNPSRRAVWMARNQENYQSTSERYFHLCTTAYFAAAYYSLANRDEDTLLHYLAQLDDVLAPSTEAMPEPYFDPSACFPHMTSKPTDDSDDEFEDSPADPFKLTGPSGSNSNLRYDSNDFAMSMADYVTGVPNFTCNQPTPSNCPPSASSASMMPQPSHIPSSTSAPASSTPTVRTELLLEPIDPLLFLNSVPAATTTAGFMHPSSDGRQKHVYPRSVWNLPTEEALPPTSGRNFAILTDPPGFECYVPPPAQVNSSSVNYHGEDSMSGSIPFDTTGEFGSTVSPGEDSSEETVSQAMYVPSEDFKGILRAATHLIRAEGALLTNDYATCMQWVDEAEKEVCSVPDFYLHHKVFLVDVTALKTVFHTKCPFPSGTRSIAEEFERRVLEETKRRGKAVYKESTRP